jgi:hypothetical protein
MYVMCGEKSKYKDLYKFVVVVVGSNSWFEVVETKKFLSSSKI